MNEMRIILGNEILSIVPEVLGRELVNLLILVLLCGGVAAQVLLLNVIDGQVLLHLKSTYNYYSQ